MPTATSLRRMRHFLRASLALVLVAQVACLPRITERCRLVTNPTPPPSLPTEFAELDALVLRRATDMTVASRDLNSSLVIIFHKDFAELLLPALCERLEQARVLAMAGRTAEAGRKYQALLVSSQVLAFGVAIQAMAQYADRRLQAGGQVSQTQEKFAIEAEPIFRAALSEDPREIERALNAHPDVFTVWATLLEQWPSRVDDGAHKAQVAMVVWDIAFLVVATYQAAGAAAEIAASRRPPMPPLPAFATAEGAAALSSSGPAALELAETLRRLIALGALDAGVVAALSRSFGATQMSAGSAGGAPPRGPTGSAQPQQAKDSGSGARVNKVGPHPEAQGPHTSFKRDPASGKVTGYTELDASGNPVKRFRGEGKPHGGRDPPFVLEPKPGKGPGSPPKVPRTPRPDELPKGYDFE